MSEANTSSGQLETKEFQSETKKLLDIVIHSLYTEREVFLRELLSNAADALEKMRHLSLLEKEVFDRDVPLEINITLDDKAQTLTLVDSGIGMSHDELIANLGTIAHSGSKTFLTELSEAEQKNVSLIGQFGVGFYSAFMVAKRVRVQSRSYHPEALGYEWSSDGAGTYDILPCPGLHRGTKLIVELKEESKQFAEADTIRRVIKQYSSFVSFPIKVDGEVANTVQALWSRNKNEIKKEEYDDFYKFVANAYDEPRYHLHFSVDAPLAIHSLLFIPKENFEKMGFGRMDPGVSLYCQKVLIDQHSEKILPEWLRFVKGVIDSDDLPINLSRQALQDNSLVAKINKIVTTRLLKYLAEQAKEDPDSYIEFWNNFGIFLKEGATSDYTHREAIAKLLRFESSQSEPGKLVALSEYVERMPEGQKEIYYINGPSRQAIEAGPYLEAFRNQKIEIIYTMEPIDDFVFSHLGEFEGKKLISADRADLELPETNEEKKEEGAAKEESLAEEATTKLTAWMKTVLAEKVKEVKVSKRLVTSPAMIVNPDGFLTSSMERVMRAAGQEMHSLGAKNLEINSSHPLIKDLALLRESDEGFAKSVVEQIFDNTLIQAGLMTEPRSMVERSYEILARAVKK